MKKRVYGLASLCGAMLAALTQLPFAWVGPHLMRDGMGPNVRYSGTVWVGQITGIDYVGTAQFKISIKHLASGKLPLSFSTSSPVMTLSGGASHKRIEGLKFYGQLAGLPTNDGRLKELAGDVNIDVSELEFNNECILATGKVDTDFLTKNQARWQWRGPFLSGPLRCDEGDLIVQLSGSENGQIIQANLRIKVNGAYRADFSVRTSQQEAGVILPLYGFENRNGVFHLTEQGKWR